MLSAEKLTASFFPILLHFLAFLELVPPANLACFSEDGRTCCNAVLSCGCLIIRHTHLLSGAKVNRNPPLSGGAEQHPYTSELTLDVPYVQAGFSLSPQPK